MSGSQKNLPNINDLLIPVLEDLPPDTQLPFIAALERGAGTRYRGWAKSINDKQITENLLACAAREENIATNIEALAGCKADDLPGLDNTKAKVDNILDETFGNHAIAEQFRIQARAERDGAAFWRRFASNVSVEEHSIFEACACLEEESATCLEQLLERRDIW